MAWLVSLTRQSADWPHWERHPMGEEILTMLDGRLELTLDQDGSVTVARLDGGRTFVVPRGAWHRARVLEPGLMLGITYGEGTEHRPWQGP